MSVVASNAVVEKVEGMRVPLKSWARDVEASALDQARNLARLPFALRHVALMPDAHTGYGMPIGGVFFSDAAVVPYAVGVDIGCGVRLIALGDSIDWRGLERGTIKDFLEAVHARVPVGNGPGAQHLEARGDPFLPDVAATSHRGVEPYLHEILDKGEVQLGTLGGGNHFIELQRGEDDRVYVMLHSGSRSVGKKICDHHHKVAKKMMTRWRVLLPDPNLAWLPWDTDEGRAYWSDMHVALGWAEENRSRMAAAVLEAAADVLGADGREEFDVHHNYAALESHFGQNGIVHRKGAVRARLGERVLIPGSMGTASYVAEGLGSEDSFMSCQHGAGRAMSRGGARRLMASRDLEADLMGTVLVTPDRRGVVDEAPLAYKSVESVMEASTDLVRPVLRTLPLGVLKG